MIDNKLDVGDSVYYLEDWTRYIKDIIGTISRVDDRYAYCGPLMKIRRGLIYSNGRYRTDIIDDGGPFLSMAVYYLDSVALEEWKNLNKRKEMEAPIAKYFGVNHDSLKGLSDFQVAGIRQILEE